MLCVISCRSSKIEYRYKVIYPRIDFIDYPDSKGKLKPLDKNLNQVTDLETDIDFVLSDFSYFQETVEFKSHYDSMKEYYYTFIEDAKKLEIELNSK